MSEEIVIAVEGCCHGELDSIYETIAQAESAGAPKVELLIVCGDFQCVKDILDLQCLAVPEKYRTMNSFYKYFSGESVAPVLTIFIGGNHEASNVLQSLYYGGWVCPNIYFLGFAGVVNYKGLRIGGLSGIFNHQDYHLGHYENPPYKNGELWSVYHLRELEVYRMAHLQARVMQTPLDIFISHDWPQGIWNYGDCRYLIKRKPYFEEDIRTGKLGSPPLMALLKLLKPTYWFAAHMHVKFAAIVPHIDIEPSSYFQPESTQCFDGNTIKTRFLSLDKCLPGREFLQILKFPCNFSSCEASTNSSSLLQYDLEWLAILKKTHHLLKIKRGVVEIPQQLYPPTDSDIQEIKEILSRLPLGICIPPHTQGMGQPGSNEMTIPKENGSDEVLRMLGLEHIWIEGCQRAAIDETRSGDSFPTNTESKSLTDPNEISLNDDES